MQINSAYFNSNIYFCGSKNSRKSSPDKIKKNPFQKFVDFQHLQHIKRKLAKDSEFITLKDKFNNPVSVCINETRKNSRSLLSDGESLGFCDFSECNAPIIGDNYPNYYKNRKYLYVNSLSSSRKLKGIGTELIKEIVRESYKRGMGGRVCLNASTTKAELNSPVPFYYKLGFQSTRKDLQKKIETSMNLGLPLPKECQSTTMFLPQNRINEILFA